MDERLRFVARLLEGEKMAPLCAVNSTSRARPATRFSTRYKDHGLARRSPIEAVGPIARPIACPSRLRRPSSA